MKWQSTKSTLNGTIEIPASKSHTIRALLIATLAEGTSTIKKALLEGDGESALIAAKALGSVITRDAENNLTVTGKGKEISPVKEVFMGNSGTGTRLFATAAALSEKAITFDGDSSLRSRPMLPLLKAIKELGGTYECPIKEGNLPFSIAGPIKGGEITIDGTTSQYLSSILLTAPLLEGDTIIHVPHLNEKPYVEMTLWWLDKMDISYEANEELSLFKVLGGQSYTAITEAIAGDFSSATFSAVGAVLTGGTVKLTNVDFSDPQGDKGVFDVLKAMGAEVIIEGTTATVSAQKLVGTTIDLNSMPDALPALSVLATQAEGETHIVNVAQARIKETDRIAVMCKELTKMGADIEEREDGLVIRKSSLVGAKVEGHDDHRIVMALTLAGFVAQGITTIDTAEAASVTYPTFKEDFTAIGGTIE